MIFHLVLNSLFIFVILTLMIEGILFACQIKHPRIRYLCQLLPILKIPFDFFIFMIYGESLFLNFNPFSCEMETQEFFINLIPSHIQSELSTGGHLVIPAYLETFIPQPLLNIFIYVAVILSIGLLVRKITLFIRSRLILNHILRCAQPCKKIIHNPYLLNQLNRSNTVILTSHSIPIPLAANSCFIVFPNDLIKELSQEEFEAVVVHELEHLRWKDPILKLLSEFICSFFWWIPSHWWLKRIEIEQEQACDEGVREYGIEAYSLATALLKVVKRAQYLKYHLSGICLFDSPKNSHTKRLKSILDLDSSLPKKITSLNCLAGLITCVLSFASFWAC